MFQLLFLLRMRLMVVAHHCDPAESYFSMISLDPWIMSFCYEHARTEFFFNAELDPAAPINLHQLEVEIP
jgi:hypothetical protein